MNLRGNLAQWMVFFWGAQITFHYAGRFMGIPLMGYNCNPITKGLNITPYTTCRTRCFFFQCSSGAVLFFIADVLAYITGSSFPASSEVILKRDGFPPTYIL